MLSAWFAAQGLRCVGVDACPLQREDIIAQAGDADAVFLEYELNEIVDAKPGDQVIFVDRVSAGCGATTHQLVSDRLDSLGKRLGARETAARQRRGREIAEIQSDCGSIGHVFGANSMGFSFEVRCCRICGIQEAGASR